MATKTKKKKRDEDSILVPTTGGLKKKSFKRRGEDNRTRIKEGETIPVQFSCMPTNKKLFKEFRAHSWREGKNKFSWVPCLGEDICPLCDDDDPDISKDSYAFITPIYNFKTKKYEILRGGANMAGKISIRFEKLKKVGKEKRWLTKAWDIMAIPAAFTDYDVSQSDTKKVIELDESKLLDLDKWLLDRLHEHYGDELPSASSLDDDEDEDDEDDEDDDEDEDEDDDDEDEEEERKVKAKKRKKKSRK